MDNELKSRHVFAARLREALDDKGWSQSELARRTDISDATISRYCHGSTAVSMHNAQKIASVLECGIDVLVEC